MLLIRSWALIEQCTFHLQFVDHVEEAVWAVEVMKTSGKAVGATLCISPHGDMQGVPPGECAVRLVKAGTFTFYNLLSYACRTKFDPLRPIKEGNREISFSNKADTSFCLSPLSHHFKLSPVVQGYNPCIMIGHKWLYSGWFVVASVDLSRAKGYL